MDHRAEPASRFDRCRRATIETPLERCIEAAVAERFTTRLLGLAGLDPAFAPPLLLPRCSSIHTHRMRFELDVCFLALLPPRTGRARVLSVMSDLSPGRRVSLPRGRWKAECSGAAVAVLELHAGLARDSGIERGAELAIELAAQPPRRPPSKVPGAFSTSSNGPAGVGSGAGSPGAGGSP